MVGLVVYTAALTIRVTYRVTPSLRLKSGESESEARTILLGTYRTYTWLVWFEFAVALLNGVFGFQWVGLSLVAILAIPVLLILVRAVYWRLGYDTRRWVLILGHLSGLFGLIEAAFVLKNQVLGAPAGHGQPS